MLPSASELAKLPSFSNTTESVRKKRKGPKGPNPLSVKKKTKKTKDTLAKSMAKPMKEDDSQKVGEKRKREADDGEPFLHESRLPDEVKGGHKRKRRRRAGTATSSATVTASETVD